MNDSGIAIDKALSGEGGTDDTRIDG